MVEFKTQVQIIDKIPFDLDASKIMRRMPLHGGKKRFEKVIQDLLNEVGPVARPKALYKISYVESKNPGSVRMDGVEFKSTLLQVNLEKGQMIFPFIVTCGQEVDVIKVLPGDTIKYYCLDMIKNSLAFSAANYLQKFLIEKYKLGQLSVMNPGELDSWPLNQQKELFSILGNVEDKIGVKLTDNYGMIPIKSRSGIYFSAKVKFESCQFCPRQRCVGRRAAYDPDLVKKYKEKAKGICG